VASKGIWYVAGVVWKPKRSTKYTRIAAMESAAMTVVLRCQRPAIVGSLNVSLVLEPSLS